MTQGLGFVNARSPAGKGGRTRGEAWRQAGRGRVASRPIRTGRGWPTETLSGPAGDAGAWRLRVPPLGERCQPAADLLPQATNH